MPLDTDTFHAEPPFSTAGAISPREVTGLAHDVTASLPSAPKLGAVLHVWARLGANAKGQLTLLIEVVHGTGKFLRQGDRLGGLVQEAIT